MSESICYTCTQCHSEPCFTHIDGHRITNPPETIECIEGSENFMTEDGCYHYSEVIEDVDD